MPSGLLRGIFWRSLLGYAVSGLVFGELYGSAFVGSISVRPNTVEVALGNALEWVIQRWVTWSGREVRTSQAPWLEGPVGGEYIGAGFYVGYATEVGLEAVADDEDAGLLPDLGALAGEGFDPALIRPEIRDFYRRTARYDLCVRMEWRGPFRHPPRTLIYLVGATWGSSISPLTLDHNDDERADTPQGPGHE